MMPMSETLDIKIGVPFEYDWKIDYDLFSEDKIDSSIPFNIKNESGDIVLSAAFNYGLTLIKFDDEDCSRITLSIFDTDVLNVGQYSYSYEIKTFGGKLIKNINGTINVYDNDGIPPAIKREVRPWDLLRSKKPGEAGERATDEEAEKRISICKECPRFIKTTSQCKECGCIMNLKTKLAAASCPLGKW